ncbi:MAG: hypothetical protein A2Z38_04115 [Planctomycetes bacterium RBG_19FT_COMBO_48_8]|nr:MAG: hypothetical protein A2Z38_04115 [Planctomycetes bacterium RBG_19FT_COMBO_48_8]
MSKIKIEKKISPPPYKRGNKKEYEDFLIAIKKKSIGESFIFSLTGQHRLVLSACKILLNKEFITRKEKDGLRVYRIS